VKKYNILVTGCGGDIGQSIGKILKESSLFDKVIGADISDEHAGLFLFDQLVNLPLCSSPDYFSRLEKILVEFGIDLLLPISEPELRMFTEQGVEKEIFEIPLICANLRSRKVGFDKLFTSYFLKETNLPFPETSVISTMSSGNFPMILKSRNGSGSKSIFIVSDPADFSFYKQKYPDFIVQELIANSPDEFTCGLFRANNGEIRTIIYKRKLVGGYSGYGEVVIDKSIEAVLTSIAQGLDLRGSINVQLKISTSGPCVFEINPRFSSTVKFRHMMGFEDLIWSIQDVLGIGLSEFKSPQQGKKFYKGFYEYTD
jgi:carbamoyl-phosphate synthase large subunit